MRWLHDSRLAGLVVAVLAAAIGVMLLLELLRAVSLPPAARLPALRDVALWATAAAAGLFCMWRTLTAQWSHEGRRAYKLRKRQMKEQREFKQLRRRLRRHDKSDT